MLLTLKRCLLALCFFFIFFAQRVSFAQNLTFTLKPAIGKYEGFCYFGGMNNTLHTIGKLWFVTQRLKPITNSVYDFQKTRYSHLDNVSYNLLFEVSTNKNWNLESGIILNERAGVSYAIGFLNYNSKPQDVHNVSVGFMTGVDQLKIPLYFKKKLATNLKQNNKQTDFNILLGLNYVFTLQNNRTEMYDETIFNVNDTIIVSSKSTVYSKRRPMFCLGTEIVYKKKDKKTFSYYVYYEFGQKLVFANNIYIYRYGSTYYESIFTTGNTLHFKIAYNIKMRNNKIKL